ncbi:MAG: hypothetical protein JWP64_2709 [Pseudonocardia sp.]|uniref:hypothetical protein n=1 Tax=Pseudonocardia sp. TaxID=60912 RepID=UPI00260193D4|nr:hypothetical protein [Pseudonocardia sp.]MCU1627760.1 hypothetical protein [Pseudonocardia sp.]
MPEKPRTAPANVACPAECRRDHARVAHHDRLLRIETEPDAIVELFEVAVTWAELEYPVEEMVAPSSWPAFAERHRWKDPERALRILALASDVALRGTRTPAPARNVTLSMASGDGICPTLVGTPSPSGAPRLRLARP